MESNTRLSPASKTAMLLCGAVLCTLSSAISAHQDVRSLEQFRSDVLPSALELPVLQRRIDVLKEQVEAADLQRAYRGGETEERIRAFVVPAEISRNRIVGYLDAVRTLLTEEKSFQDMTTVVIGEPSAPDVNGIATVDVQVTMHIAPGGLHTAIAAMNLGGSFTIGDVLSKRDIELLLALTEQENPAGIVSLEQFLDTDLLTYAKEPRLSEDRLLKSFTAPAFATAVQTSLSTDAMKDIRRLLSGSFGETLKKNQLWPPMLLSVDGLRYRQMTPESVELDWRLRTAIRPTPGA